MIREVRTFDVGRTFRVGVASGCGRCRRGSGRPISARADRLRSGRPVPRRDEVVFDGPSMRVSSSSRARRWPASSVATSPRCRFPRRSSSGSNTTPPPASRACHLDAVRNHGGFAGVHLIPVSRYRGTAATLEARRRALADAVDGFGGVRLLAGRCDVRRDHRQRVGAGRARARCATATVRPGRRRHRCRSRRDVVRIRCRT